MLAIRFPAKMEKRLERLAKRTGRTKTYYVREAVLRQMEDLEDIHLAEQAYAQYLKSGKKAIPLEEVMTRHGISVRDLREAPPVRAKQESFFSENSIAQLAKAQRVKPLKSLRTLEGGWPSDEEPDDVLQEIYRDRE